MSGWIHEPEIIQSCKCLSLYEIAEYPSLCYRGAMSGEVTCAVHFFAAASLMARAEPTIKKGKPIEFIKLSDWRSACL